MIHIQNQTHIEDLHQEDGGFSVLRFSVRFSLSLQPLPLMKSDEENKAYDLHFSPLEPAGDPPLRLKHILDEVEISPTGEVSIPADSPLDSMNWSTMKKMVHTMSFSAGSLITQIGSSILSPASTSFQQQFGVGRVVSLLPTTLFIIGIGLGPMCFAPLSEVLGRKKGVFVPLFISSIFLCWTATCDGFASLCVTRFFAGLFGAAPLVTSGGALADMWSRHHRAAALACMGSGIILGASIAPIFGSLILENSGTYGWRWCMWLTAWAAAMLSVVCLIFLDETHRPLIEQAAAKTLKRFTQNGSYRSDHDKWHLTMHEFLTVHLMRPIQLLLTPMVFLVATFASFVYGVMYLIITSVSLGFSDKREWSGTSLQLPLIAYGLGFICGNIGNLLFSMRYARRLSRFGHLEPEERLVPMMCCAWCFPTGMFIYAWTIDGDLTHWIVPLVGLAFAAAGVAFIFQGCLVYLVDAFHRYAASATASSTLFRSLFAAVFPLFAKDMFDTL